MEVTSATNSLKECSSTPYKRRKQTSQALEALGKLFTDSSFDDLDNNKLNKNDILSLTLSRLLRRKYWSSNICNRKLNRNLKFYYKNTLSIFSLYDKSRKYSIGYRYSYRIDSR